MSAKIEHANVTVSDPHQTARMLIDIFDWRIRWEGPGMQTGYTVHVGSDDSYVALFSYGDTVPSSEISYKRQGGLNHIGIVVDDIGATEAKVKEAGYTPGNHGDYEPGKRFYFHEENGIEIEVVSYN